MNTDDFAPCKPFRLSAGSHNGPKEGMCAMEMLSWFAGEEWSDRPECACPVIAGVVRIADDSMSQEERDRLQQYLPPLDGSRDPDAELARAQIFLDWMWEHVLPALQEQADRGGYGAVWRAMCEKKDEAAAEAAAEAARWAASVWAWAAARAGRLAAEAADPAWAAAEAAWAARWATKAGAAVWPTFFPALQKAIEAGKHGDPTYTEAHVERARELRELVG